MFYKLRKGNAMHYTYKLSNGTCLVYEKMPFSKIVSVGLWIRAGSMYETKKENGISHFIEHMLFKGTKKRSARRLAEEMDFVGGQMNAYTSRECTCYYTKALSESLELSIDLLSDMYYNSLFSESDIELERKVIIEEINMYEDSPEDVALDTVTEIVWQNPLGYQIAGTEETVEALTREMMLDYMKRRYTPENTVISVAGSFDEKELIRLCEKYFSEGVNAENEEKLTKPVFRVCREERVKDIEQAHISIAYPGCPIGDENIYPLSILNNIFGGSMSGRLFQSLREKYGLCYSVYSYTASFPQAGMLGIYAGLNENELSLAEKLIDEETEKMRQGVSEYELEKAKSQIKCGVIMSRESVSSRMSDNGKEILLTGRIRSEKEILKKIDKVTAEEIRKLSEEIFRKENKAVFILKNQG